jgi:uncharacterized protein (DUF433 family)
MAPLPRITFNPDVMGGKARIRGMRATAGMIVAIDGKRLRVRILPLS